MQLMRGNMRDTEKKEFNIGEYMTKGVENIVKNAIKATLKNPAESIFMAKFALASKEASKRRAALDKEGEHIPAFLIASITSNCNLHCAGCYSRANHACSDEAPVKQLDGSDWKKIFDEAEELGVSFILLAGGEPMIRMDVIEEASKKQNIFFPIFTNGTLMNDAYISLFTKARNLFPVISIEGLEEKTDDRRGRGVYTKVLNSMSKLQANGILFGASITVTSENIDEVYSEDFITRLQDMGAKAVFYVEYVPVSEETKHLAPDDALRDKMASRLALIREQYSEMVFVSFPGDEKSSGGCVAAGRGFFHINSHGGAEPCPFSPYSDINVKDTSLREAMHSKLFMALQENGVLMEDHSGGCILFEKKSQVEDLLNK